MVTDVLRRKVFEPIYEARNGGPKLAYWRELEKTQYLPEVTLREKQWERLSSLMHFVYSNNSFYRRRFDDCHLKPDEIRSPEDFKRLPVLTKKEIRENFGAMISSGSDTKKLLKFKTGGSTGKALELYISEDCSERRNACARRHDRWTGWEVGEPVGAVWGNPELPVDMKGRLRNWLLAPHIYLDTMNVTDRSVTDFAIAWKKAKPTLLFGHAHSLYLLSRYVQRLQITEIAPRAVISTSMTLLPHERQAIEKTFGLKVFDRYGCEEVSLIGSECERHEGLHLNIEHLYIEFLSGEGEEVKPGQEGRIVVTDLMNKSMPFIRYEVEDMGVPADQKCSCGRGLPLMKGVSGRLADFLVKMDGTRVAGISLIENTLTNIPGIEQMQIIQDSPERITINLVTLPVFNRSNRTELEGYFQSLLGREARITMQYMKQIPPEKSGKYCFLICNIPGGNS